MARDIPWFNPSEMDDTTVLALATGRGSLLAEFWGVVNERLTHRAAGRHWLVTGTRGAGKSYFLRLAQAQARQVLPADQARLVMLPQELHNVHEPHEFLDEIRRMLRVSEGDTGHIAQWRVQAPDRAWADSLRSLLAAFDEPLLIVGVENFQKLLPTVFKDDVSASWLRQLMAHEPRIMLLATAVDGAHDEDYQQRLFRQFEHHALPPWHEAAHRKYLLARARLLGRVPSPMQLARIDAYSRYTGGNARIAAVLAGALLDADDMLDASNDFNTTLDKLSDYYLEQMDRIPLQTKKLFDALIRGGEPCSQTEQAALVGARQRDIPRAFLWLMESGYLIAERIKGQKDTRYRVADRLFVQWYRMRNLAPGQRGRLAVMAELLADTVAFRDKWRHAQGLLDRGEAADARLLADLGLKERGIRIDALQSQGLALDEIVGLGQRLVQNDAKSLRGEGHWVSLQRYLIVMETYPSDMDFQRERDIATKIASACQRFDGSIDGRELVGLVVNSLSLSTPQKLQCIVAMTHAAFSPFQWDELAKTLQSEAKEFIKLQPTEGEVISQRKQWNLRRGRHPWATGWTDLSGEGKICQYIYNHPAITSLEMDAVQAAAALAAFCAWREAGDLDQAKADLEQGRKRIATLIEQGLAPLAQRLLEIALAAQSKENEPSVAGIFAMIRTHHGTCLSDIGRQAEAVAELERAVQDWQHAKDLPGQAFTKGRLGWTLGPTGRLQEAQNQHEQALALLASHPDSRAKPWHIGQVARYRIDLQGLDDAWEWLQTQMSGLPSSAALHSLQQLGDAVWDCQQTNGETAGFALARTLIEKVAGSTLWPPKPALQALFIDMLDMGVALDTLSDLANELPLLTAQGTVPTDIQTLADTLQAWIGDLRLDDAQRARVRPGQDPDLSTTLDSLNKELSAQARIRLGLMPPPALPASTDAYVHRILKFVR